MRFKIEIGFGPKRYVFSLKSEERPTPLTRSFEDDMVAISERYGSCWRAGLPVFERSRYLHSFALYRFYRAVRRWFDAPMDKPFTIGEIASQGRRFDPANTMA